MRAIYVAGAERGNILMLLSRWNIPSPMRIAPQAPFFSPLGISVDDEGNLYVPIPQAHAS